VTPFARVTRVPVYGTTIAVRRAGSGPPVVLLHGVPTSSRLWDGLAPELTDRFEVVAPDLLGYGESAKPLTRDVSVRAQAEIVVDLLDTLGLARAALVGHDVGGAVAQMVAVRHPDRVSALALVDSACFDSWPAPELIALRRAAAVAIRLPRRVVVAGLTRALIAQAPEPAHEALAAGLEVFGRDRAALRALFHDLEALDGRETEEIVPALGRLSVPALVVWGAADTSQRPAYAPRLRDLIPGATLVLLDAGHFVPLQRPLELAAELAGLLERSAG
jgi:pimeloyl-ACP methyl ester carboxylesterase